MPSNLVLPNEWDIEFSKERQQDGRILLTCTYCVSQGKTENVAWLCMNDYWAGEQMKTHRGEHFAIPLDRPS